MPSDWKLVGTGPLHLNDLPQAAAELVKNGEGLSVWLLKGEMGTGKTTLVKQIVKQFGVERTVASPTFSIVNQYGVIGDNVIYHFDLYRLKNELEALDIGMEEYLISGSLCLIEWPEKLEKLLPDKYFEVQIQLHDSLTRKIYYCRHD